MDSSNDKKCLSVFWEGDKWRIVDRDKYNIAVQRKKIRTKEATGIKYIDWKDEWYPNNIETAVDYVVREHVRGIEKETLAQVLEAIRDLKRELFAVVKKGSE